MHRDAGVKEKLQLKSTAKINLTLEVLHRREDGYHQLHTVFQELALFDIVELRLNPRRTVELDCSRKDLPAKEGNLAYEAASLLQSLYTPLNGVRITLDKRIPVSAGLGGGSSNAAAVLKGLNSLWGLGLSEENLLQIAARLGSDVPFFLKGGTAVGEGRGEIITSLPDFPPAQVLLVIPPGNGLSAGKVYNSLSVDKIKKHSNTAKFVHYLHQMDEAKPGKVLDELSKLCINHLEHAVFELDTEVRKIKDELLKEGAKALVSGSGPTVFALSREEQKLERIGEKFAGKGYKVILTETRPSQHGGNM